MTAKEYHVIGMSPGNSYFKDEEISYLLKTTIDRFGKVAVLIADIPAISTYVALGYPENRARRDKAIPKGNALKNRVRKAITNLGYSSEIVKIIDWENEVENNPDYQKHYEKVLGLYTHNTVFQSVADTTTRSVLEASKRTFDDIESATKIAAHYLLSEFAFLEYAPTFLKAERVVYVYHKNWQVYEDYIAGKFDHIIRSNLDFLLLENPYETYNPIWGLEDEPENGSFSDVLDRIEKTKKLRVGFTNYVPALIYDKEYDNFSGIFYEIIIEIAKKYDWHVVWNEEVGYGVITEGLNNNRFDIFGSTVWPTPERKSKADFSISLYESPVFTWVRSDYGKNEQQIKDDQHARVAVKENDITDSIATSDFPNNRQVKIPQLSNTTDVLKLVAENRADFTFVEPYLAEHFNQTSDVKLVATDEKPIRTYENTIIFKKGEQRLKELLDNELSLLKQNGTLKQLIKKYTGSENTFLAEK